MSEQKNIPYILFVENNDEDFELIRNAFSAKGLGNNLKRARDGEEALELIFNPDTASNSSSLPGLVVLDLNLPRKTGIEVLRAIKRNDASRYLPIVILTVSTNEKEIAESYNLGANSFIKKPQKAQDMIDILEIISQYWLNVVKLPSGYEKG